MADFLYLYRGSERVNAGLSPQQMQEYLGRFQAWIESLAKGGKLSACNCAPLSSGGRTIKGPKAIVADGPYAETKDLIGGYTVISAEDLDVATEIACGCPFLTVGGTVEIRPVINVKQAHER